MNLIIDTSSRNLLAILQDEKNIFVAPKVDKKHQENLLPCIEKLLIESKNNLDKVENIGVVVGPGSFTGIRLAVSTTKAFCYVDIRKKIVPINMLDLMASVAKKQSNKKFCVLIKCTSSKIYVGQYDKNGKKISQFVLMKDKIKKIEDYEKYYSYDEDFFLFGDFKKLELTDQDYVDFINEKIKNEEFIENERLEPLYMALSQAEEELLKKANKNEKK